MEKLIAVVRIQYKGKRYIPGEEIPADSAEMVEAWKRAGSVKVLEKEVNLSEDKKEMLHDEEDPAKASGDGTTEDPAKAPAAEGKKKK